MGKRPGPSSQPKELSNFPPVLVPPTRFGIVEPCVYRSNTPIEANYGFLEGLRLQTALLLSPELPTRALQEFFALNQIHVHHLGLDTWRLEDKRRPISDELIKEALEAITDVGQHPILLICSSGYHQTGVVVGCLRRLQKWSFAAILSEYRGFSGKKARHSDQQQIEMFDLDLFDTPATTPMWFREAAPPRPTTPQTLSTAPFELAKSLGVDDY